MTNGILYLIIKIALSIITITIIKCIHVFKNNRKRSNNMLVFNIFTLDGFSILGIFLLLCIWTSAYIVQPIQNIHGLIKNAHGFLMYVYGEKPFVTIVSSIDIWLVPYLIYKYITNEFTTVEKTTYGTLLTTHVCLYAIIVALSFINPPMGKTTYNVCQMISCITWFMAIMWLIDIINGDFSIRCHIEQND